MSARSYEAQAHARHPHLRLSDEAPASRGPWAIREVFVGDVGISAITLAELEYGITCSPTAELANRAQLESFTEDVPVVPFETLAARAYGPTRFASRERSRDALDKLIAAHAISLDVTLVTNNESDFVGYPGLKVENWVSSH